MTPEELQQQIEAAKEADMKALLEKRATASSGPAKGPIEAIDQHAKQIEAFRVRMNPETRKAQINEVIEKSRAKFDVPGLLDTINIAPESFVQQVGAQAASQFDNALSDEANKLTQEQGDIAATLATVIETVSQIADPFRVEDATGASATEHEMRRLRLVVERDHVERRLAGKSYGQIADLYEAADDRLDVVLRWTIEDQQRRHWADIALASDPDFRGVERLRTVIATAQRARVEKSNPELIAAEEKLKALTSSAVLGFLLKDARGSRGRVA